MCPDCKLETIACMEIMMDSQDAQVQNVRATGPFDGNYIYTPPPPSKKKKGKQSKLLGYLILQNA